MGPNDNTRLGDGSIYFNGEHFATGGIIEGSLEYTPEDANETVIPLNTTTKATIKGTIEHIEPLLMWCMTGKSFWIVEWAKANRPKLAHLAFHAKKQRARKKNVRRCVVEFFNVVSRTPLGRRIIQYYAEEENV